MGTKLSQILYPNLKELDTEYKERTTKTCTLTEKSNIKKISMMSEHHKLVGDSVIYH